MKYWSLLINNPNIILELSQALQAKLSNGRACFDADQPIKYLGLCGFFTKYLQFHTYAAALAKQFKHFKKGVKEHGLEFFTHAGLLETQLTPVTDIDTIERAIKAHLATVIHMHNRLDQGGFAFIMDTTHILVGAEENGSRTFHMCCPEDDFRTLQEYFYTLIDGFPSRLCEELIADFPDEDPTTQGDFDDRPTTDPR